MQDGGDQLLQGMTNVSREAVKFFHEEPTLWQATSEQRWIPGKRVELQQGIPPSTALCEQLNLQVASGGGEQGRLARVIYPLHSPRTVPGPLDLRSQISYILYHLNLFDQSRSHSNSGNNGNNFLSIYRIFWNFSKKIKKSRVGRIDLNGTVCRRSCFHTYGRVLSHSYIASHARSEVRRILLYKSVISL